MIIALPQSGGCEGIVHSVDKTERKKSGMWFPVYTIPMTVCGKCHRKKNYLLDCGETGEMPSDLMGK
jgi:hypothetical protein